MEDIIKYTADWSEEEALPFVEAVIESFVESRFGCVLSNMFDDILLLLSVNDVNVVKRTIDILYGLLQYDLLPHFDDHRDRTFIIRALKHLLFGQGLTSFRAIMQDVTKKQKYIQFTQDLMDWYFLSDAYQKEYVQNLGDKWYLFENTGSRSKSKKLAKFMNRYVDFIYE